MLKLAVVCEGHESPVGAVSDVVQRVDEILVISRRVAQGESDARCSRSTVRMLLGSKWWSADRFYFDADVKGSGVSRKRGFWWENGD